MQDRVPVNPGRVLVTPENGGAAYYATLTRADNPTQEGTPLNKTSLLKDATAALFGLGMDAVPDDVLNVLSRFHNGLGNEYVWAKQTSKVYPVFNRTEYGRDCVITGDTSGTVTFYNSYEIENGSVVLKDIWQTFSVTSSNVGTVLSASVLNAGVKYLYRLDGTVVRTIPGETHGYYSDGLLQNVLMPTETFTGDFTVSYETVGYVNSPNPNAYPPAVSDGYTYMALGQLGNKTQIATGSYVGTGTYGSSNPTRLTFPFNPKMVLIASDNEWMVWFKGMSYGFTLCTYTTVDNNINDSAVKGSVVAVTETTNGISWYSKDNGVSQMNNGTVVYNYTAIG